MSSARSTRRYSRAMGFTLAAAIAAIPALAGTASATLVGTASAASVDWGDLKSGSSNFGSSGEQPTLPEIPPPSAAAIRLDEARNFRDIGGYRTSDGQTVRTGLVFRSNKLSSLSDSDQAKLTAANLTLDVDLRNASERKEAPDRIPAGIRYQVADVVSLENGIGFHEAVPLTLGRALIDAATSGSSDIGQTIGYPFMVNYRGSDVAFHDLITAIANNPDGATVYHCSAGKDRTGWSTAILLSILGVPRDVISADFMASNAYLGRDDAVELSWLNAAYDQAERIYGSMDAYIREGLDIDQATIDTLRAKLLV
ncbi:tyrosine-protein phosphatase [Rhodococcus sp. NPDC003348]